MDTLGWRVGSTIRHVMTYLTPETVVYENSVLPSVFLRPGGAQFRSNRRYLDSARAEATRLEKHLKLGPDSSVLDVGCGSGRLAIGLLANRAEFHAYTGVDVDPRLIAWCQRHLGSRCAKMSFLPLDIANARYNPHGKTKLQQDGFRLPVADASQHVIYLYSVFSHLLPDDVRAYLREFARSLVPTGKLFCTAFVEDGVPDCEVNPQGYLAGRWFGPLHCVRYSRAYFTSMLEAEGWRIERLEHGVETDGQTGIYAARAR